ncbi:alcohol oxidase [Dentipellis sp. KUC8613]|nr:alcohol oxidase [Dentipellis sp. KUC8613]
MFPFLLSLLPLSVVARPERLISSRSAPPVTYGVSSDPTTAANQTFDYIIIGGGTAGMTMAARLSEDPNISVLVVEAGGDDRMDPFVSDVYKFTAAYGTPMDWGWATDQNRTIHGGRTLGGGSAINGATWTRGMKEQYDSWSKFLEPSESDLGWNWDGLFPYMKKAEGFTRPNENQRSIGANDVPEYHGFTGPVQSTFSKKMYAGPQQPYFAQTVTSLTGLKLLPDINGGDSHCVAFVPSSMDPRNGDSRSSAAVAYLSPVEKDRKNWLTLVNHQVTSILFTPSNAGLQTATGVYFAAEGGPYYTANARLEVILSAGAINSPALLQHSGIGDAAHLSSLGISTVIDLPAVGRNLQEQTVASIGANGTGFDVGGMGPTNVIAFPGLKEVFGDKAEKVGKEMLGNLTAWARDMAAKGVVISAEALEKEYKVQAELILNSNAPIIEFLYNTGFPGDLSIVMWPLLPFSRGRVFITSTDPFTRPQVDVNYYSIPFDLQVNVAGATLARKILQSPPLSNLYVAETVPGLNIVPADDPFDAWADWLKSTFGANSHPMATTALGSVVDGRLRVRGTTNLRVVDAGIIPLQFSGHLQSTIYGLAEKAADIIKRGL